MHPLLAVLLDAAAGIYPPVDGGVTMHRALDNGHAAVVSFTGHAHIASWAAYEDLESFHPDGFGRASHPSVLLRLARGGMVGTHDVTLVAHGTGDGTLRLRLDLDDHHRVRHARSIRSNVAVYGDEHGLVTVATGLAGRTEVGVEAFDMLAANGHGRRLIRESLGMVQRGIPVFAAVSPGNARSLRAFLACGFTPVASEVIITPGNAGEKGHGPYESK